MHRRFPMGGICDARGRVPRGKILFLINIAQKDFSEMEVEKPTPLEEAKEVEK